MKNTFKFLIAAGMLAFGSVASATTIQTLDFSTGTLPNGQSPAGKIVYDNNGTDVIGTDITIGSLIVEGSTNGSDGSYVADAVLTFNTSNGSIGIDGDVPGFVPQTNLFRGSISSWSFTDGGVDIFFVEGSSGVDAGLLTTFGLDNGVFSFVGFSLESANGNVLSTDLLLTETNRNISTVPIPAAVWLFGSGLIGLVGVARRKDIA